MRRSSVCYFQNENIPCFDCELTDIARKQTKMFTRPNYYVTSDFSWPRWESNYYQWPTHRKTVKCATITPTSRFVEQMQNGTAPARTTKRHTAEWNITICNPTEYFQPCEIVSDTNGTTVYLLFPLLLLLFLLCILYSFVKSVYMKF